MTMSKGAVGNLINRYRAVLKKCHMLNVFGSLAVAGMLVMGGAGVAGAQTIVNDEVNVQNETVSDSSGDLDGLVYKVNDNGKLSITGGSYSGNKTARSGGVLVGTKNQAHIEIVSTVFSQNSAQYDGGAIGNFGYLTVKDSTFEGNTAQIGSDGSSHVIDNCDMGGGAIAIGSGSHVSISGSTFTGNASGKDGGAVATRKFYGAYDTDSADVGLTVSGSTFTNNTAGKSISDTPYNYNTAITGLYESGNGGALFNTFNDTLVEGSSFTGNTAINGGAVANFYDRGKTENYGSITIKNSTFTNNTAVVDKKAKEGSGMGGAIYSYASKRATDKDFKVTVVDSQFTGNTAYNGGAIANNGNLDVSGATFKGNTASNWGGAIVNWQDMTVKGSTFEDNVAGVVGGAIGSDSTSNAVNIASSVFKNNHSVYDGGAIGSYKGLTITGSTFEGNTAQLDKSDSGEWNVAVEDATAIGGGAISLGAVSATAIATIENTLFKNNVSGYNGGAIGTRMGKDANNSAAKLDISATFTGNRAKNGGAIYNTFYADNGLGKGAGVTVTGMFTGNSASENGGAVYNDGAQDKAQNAGGVMTITDSLFENNTADKGGAIYNTGTLHFAGTNTFKGNNATEGNDIYNVGSVTVESGVTGLNSGYTQEKGSLAVNSGAALNAAGLELKGGTMSVAGSAVVAEGGAVAFGSGSSLIINGGSVTADSGNFITDAFGAVAGVDTALVGTAGDLYLRFDGKTYTADQYKAAKSALFELENEKALLTLLNGTLKVQEGETVVVSGTADPATNKVTLSGVTPVVAKSGESANDSDVTIASVPDQLVRVVDSNDETKELQTVGNLEIGKSVFNAKGLQVAPADAAAGVVLNLVDNSKITLIGGETEDSGVLVDGNNNAVKTHVVVGDGSALQLGMAGNAGKQMASFGTVEVQGKLDVAGNGLDTTRYGYEELKASHANAEVNLSNASILASTATLEKGAVNVLNATAHIGTLNPTGGTLFIDPAYVKIENLSGDTFGSSLLVGDGSVVEIGSIADLQTKAAEAGLNPAAFGNGFTVASGESMLALGKAVALGAGGKIVVDAGVDKSGAIGGVPVGDSAYFGNKSLLVVDSAIASGDGAIRANSAADTITVKKDAKLYLVDAKANGTYTIASGFGNTSSTVEGWNGDALITNRLVNAERIAGTDGSVTVKTTAKRASVLYPGISIPNTLDRMIGDKQNDVNSGNAGIKFLSRALEPQFLAEGDVIPTLDGAAQLAYAGGVQSSTITVAQAPVRAIQDHLSLAGKVAQKGTNLHENGFDLWANAIYGSNRTRDFSAGSLDAGYNSDFAGGVIGGDWTFDAGAGKGRVGLALNVGAGDTKSRGDFNSTKNDFDFWGMSLYGGWSMDNVNVVADLGYSASKNELKQDIPSSLGLCGRIKGDVDSSVITAGVKAEYMVKTDVLDVMPHVGVRYMAVKTDSFTTKLDMGGDLFHTDSDLQHVWQFPVGVNLSKTIETESGWKVKPQADLSVVPAAGDTKTKIDVRTPGVNASDSMKRRVMDTTSFDGVFGVEVQKDNVSFGLGYNIQASEHQTGQGVTASFMYKF